MWFKAHPPFLNKDKTSILGSTLTPSKSVSVIANPPKTKGVLFYLAASTANFISNPGIKGWKSLGKALKASKTAKYIYNLSLKKIPLGLYL